MTEFSPPENPEMNFSKNYTLPDLHDIKNLKTAIEVILFAADRPLSREQIYKILSESQEGLQIEQSSRALHELIEEFLVRSTYPFCIEEIQGKWVLRTKPQWNFLIRNLPHHAPPEKLSLNMCETLAVLACYQPMTKAEIDSIRGCDCQATIAALMERDLIKISGQKKSVGRPSLYKISDNFYEFFDIRDLKELKDLAYKHQASEEEKTKSFKSRESKLR